MLGVGMLLPLGDIRALSCVPPAPLCRGRHRFKLGSRQMTMLRSPRARPARPRWKRGAFQEARLSRFAVGARDLATDTESLGASECIWQLQRGVLCPATGPELVENQRHVPTPSAEVQTAPYARTQPASPSPAPSGAASQDWPRHTNEKRPPRIRSISCPKSVEPTRSKSPTALPFPEAS